jgi:hypothetical protein
MEMIVRSYKDIHGAAPTELFIHGKTNFDSNEWSGFSSAVPHTTKLVGVQIRDMADVKLFRYGANAVLRGTAVLTSDTSAISGPAVTSRACGPIPAAKSRIR